MFKNYFKIAIRNLNRYQKISIINVVGLAVGMACAILIMIWIQDELSYDQFHEKSDNIVLVLRGDSQNLTAESSKMLGPAIKSEIPQIINTTCVVELPNVEPITLQYNEKNFEETWCIIDDQFFNIFSFSFKMGNPVTVLQDPNSIILTENIAHKYFGNDNPINQTMNLFLLGQKIPLKVSAVLNNLPHNSHFKDQIYLLLPLLEKLGFDKDQIVVLPMREAVSTGSYKFLKDEFVKNPSVISASITWSIPGRANIGNGDFTSVDNPQFKDKLMKYMFVDSDFQNTYGILLAGGRSFQKKFSTDENAYMVNETAMKAFGWNNPDETVGKNILGKFHGGGTGQIIGVYKNFHFESLKNLIEPLVIKSIPEKEDFYETNSFLNLKLNSKNIAETMSFIQNKWKELFPQAPYDYFFLNEDFNLQYSYDEKICRIILSFSILAIFIACLGLYGLILFSAEQKTKEIGIRKVLGASVRSVILVLAKEFIVLVISANIIAWPIAWFVMNKWLQNFAYRIDLTLWPFLLAGLLALVIALFTVSWQVIYVATANPVESLRYE
ncbi:MAG: ABC transporter permease [Calditrichota bacterium]|jgi:ABC-type antimicrobial peptide transport system permease subunit